MRDVPECLARRYKALDELIRELNCVISKHSSSSASPVPKDSSEDVGIKLMCEFWNILKEDPNYNLTQAIQERMGLTSTDNERPSRPQRVTCYVTAHNCLNKDKDDDKKKEKKDRDVLKKVKNLCCQSGADDESKSKCCDTKSLSSNTASDVLPLSKVLCNLKEAASYDKKCGERIKDLMEAGKLLKDQIEHLEHREKEGIQLLKKADCMWSCMEETYKKKVAESMERQKILLAQFKEVDASTAKWRKNKKDLEMSIENVNKCQQEMKDKLNQKTNDMKVINMEITGFQKRIDSNKKEIEVANKSIDVKKRTNDTKIASIAKEVKRLEKLVQEERVIKKQKDKEGTNYVKEAREDLQKLCKVLLQKKLENEDLQAERVALLEEIDLLKKSCDQCQDKCKQKQKSLGDEIIKIDKETADFKVRCTRCHQCVDTTDTRRFCTDCPRCMEERECLKEGDHCSRDPTMDCVCMSVKHKFLDNVFENMYTVLEKQSKTALGKAIAETVLQSLKNSRNGKLNEETRKILQNFILTTVKKNLNLTIVGGAVKTRCELDPETYKQLMLCLKRVKVTKPPKEDKGTLAKKDPCNRWGGISECNCPKGPKACICTTKAPPPAHDPTPYPQDPDDKEDKGQVIACPHKENTACGPDCAMHAVPSSVGTDIAAWKPDPCKGNTCPFSKSMRAAQCMLGPELLSSSMKSNYRAAAPYVPDIPTSEDQIACKCGSSPMKFYTCRDDSKQLKAERIKECGKTNCDVVLDSLGHNNHESSLKERRSIYNIRDTYKNDASVQKIPSVQAEVLKIAQQEAGTEPYIPVKMTVNVEQQVNFKSDNLYKEKNSVAVKESFKISFKDKSGALMNNQISELIMSPLGDLSISLDEKTIELIEKKMKQEPFLCLFIKKTSTSNYEIDLDYINCTSNINTQRILVKRTSSGNIFLEFHEDFINTLWPCFINKESRTFKRTSGSFVSVIVTKREKAAGKEDNTHEITADNLNSENKPNSINYETQLNKLLIDNEGIASNVESEDESFMKLSSPLKKTLSGNIVINVKDMSAQLKRILSDTQQLPIMFTKTSSGNFTVKFRPDCESKTQNAMLQRCFSGGMPIIAREPVLKEVKSQNKVIVCTEKEHFKVKIRGITTELIEPSALLKSTTSENYLIVMDKEFENRYRKTMEKYIGGNGQCYVGFIKTSSDTYVIDFSSNDDMKKIPKNALLTKTPSGTIKVQVNIQVIKKCPSLKSFTSGSSKAFEQFATSSPVGSEKCCKENIKKSILLDSKSSSDTNLLYEKAKLRFNDAKYAISEPSTSLKKTPSGQYAIVLNKESKKAFVNSLKNYLENSSHGLVPIKKTISGEITISFNSNDDAIGKYDSLKITPSGNIYVLGDENRIKGTQRKSVDEDVSRESYILDKLTSKTTIKNVNPVNKCVTTTCNALPDDNFCDITKCVCKNLKSLLEDWDKKEAKVLNQRKGQSKANDVECAKMKKGTGKARNISATNTSKGKCSNKTKNKNTDARETSPHIVIKPCRCHPISEKMPSSSEQYFFVIDAICPIHKDRYKNVSNEIIEITGLCNNSQKEISKQNSSDPNKTQEIQPTHSESNWDSLNFLTPQLPSFLRDITYKKD